MLCLILCQPKPVTLFIYLGIGFGGLWRFAGPFTKVNGFIYLHLESCSKISMCIQSLCVLRRLDYQITLVFNF